MRNYRRYSAFYGDLAGARLEVDEQVSSSGMRISFKNTERVSRADLLRLLDNVLLEQARIEVTHAENNRVTMRFRN